MELFTVNRYTEDLKSPQDKEQKTSNEDEILQKLLQKAAKRKRKHEKSEAAKQEAAPVEQPRMEETKVEEKEVEKEEPKETAPAEEEATNSQDFQILGGDDSAKRKKVTEVLPPWLAYPTIIEGGNLLPDDEEKLEAGKDEASIENLSYLKDHTRQALKQMKIKRLFPVQRTVIPWILEAQGKPAPLRPRDICVSAPTGSGKTLAFAIPIVQLLNNRVRCKVRALVVLPVAELALQVFKVIRALCSKTELEVCLLSKQHRLEDEQEKLVEVYKGQMYSKADIVVTTPGRLVDHLHATKGFCLKSLKFLVIDEADRIMDAFFQNWLYHLDNHVRETANQLLAGTQPPLCLKELYATFGKVPHKLLFSATMSQDPEKLQNLRLFQPKLFTTVFALPVARSAAEQTDADGESMPNTGHFAGKYTTPAELTEQFCVTELRIKPLTLFALVEKYQWKRFLCFTNSTDTANRLAFVMQQLFASGPTKVAELSGKLSALVRTKTLTDFARGRINGLICSDALARGIDVADVDVVLSYETPRHIKTYIHRVGRTARAGRKGTAVTLLTEPEQAQFKKMLNEVGKALGEEITVSADTEVRHADIYKNAMEQLRKRQDDEKTLKIVQKRRVAQRSVLHKTQAEAAANPSRPLTLMQKLQLKAGGVDQLEVKLKQQENKLLAPAAKGKGRSKPKSKETKKQRLAKQRKAIEE
ncbi:probable ATP-dependent RNA helicase Dbp73D [Drosophila subobscura]|uniref:probable ATP-dependent RNA helicase Dbp73D n=1 Tax=Drosophila subobscura TaxID=7241 RepID=UPI00155A41B1|nr:probable ATP-dependent RNA helicase Dbp73D [Drosophila subobscura]